MLEPERLKTQNEALESAPKGMSSAERARLWAGLNRYLATEAEAVRRAARREHEQTEEKAKQNRS
jgi:hypothetical protein